MKYLVAEIVRPGITGSPEIVEAVSAEAAIEQVKGRRSVGSLRRGVVLAVWRLGNFPEQFHVTYDKPPMDEAHRSTDAKIVSRSLGNQRLDVGSEA